MNRYVFDVSNMKCGGCVSAVKVAVNDMADTTVVDVSLEKHQAIIESSKSAQVISDVISAAGFPAIVK